MKKKKAKEKKREYHFDQIKSSNRIQTTNLGKRLLVLDLSIHYNLLNVLTLSLFIQSHLTEYFLTKASLAKSLC